MTSSSQWILRTVLVTGCAWSFAVLLVVEAGLGSRYSLHPDAAVDERAVSAAALSSGGSRLDSFERYAGILQRPLFYPDRRPVLLASSEPEAEAPPPETPLNVVVTSIVITPEKRVVIVVDPANNKPQTIALGGALGGEQSAWRLVELEPRRAVFEGPGGRSSVDQRVFNGQGGEPPTPVAMASPEMAPPPGGPATGGVLATQDRDAQVAEADSPEARAEQIRRRIEERRRQMREEAERANAERGR